MTTQSWRHECWKLGMGGCLVIGGAIAFSVDRAFAQINPDSTLGAESSILTPTNQIHGGARRGANLFHSFQDFNVSPGQTVLFFDPGVTNILSRVTGKNKSDIQGTLGVTGGNANLFLINPNGIIFGQNARLDIRGSFVATTANGIKFPNEGVFSASAPEVPSSMLNVNPSALLFNQIVAQSANSITVNQATLSVPEGQSLLLVGGNVSPTATSTGTVLINGGTLSALGGRIEVGGLAGKGEVEINADDLSLTFRNDVPRADVKLVNGSVVNVNSQSANTDAGDIRITGGTITADRAKLSSNASGAGDAGSIILLADNTVHLINGSAIESVTTNRRSGSDAGTINVAATQGSVFLNQSTLNTTSSGSGFAGDISISARDQVSILDGSNIFSQGDFGTIKVAATQGSVFLNQSTLNTTNSGSSFAGDISISARDQVSIIKGSKVESQGYFGRIFIGKSDEYANFSPRIVNLDGAELNTNNSKKIGDGRAGDISIDAIQNILIANSQITSTSNNNLRTGISFGIIQLQATQGSVTLDKSSNLSTTNDGSGFAGDISITAQDQVSILNGSSIFSQGHLGRIFIGKSDEYANFSPNIVRIDDATLNTNNSDNVGSTRTGDINAGEISVRANDSISLANGARLTTSTFRQGNAGEVLVQTNGGSVSLSGSQTAIFSTVESGGVGEGGNIRIETGSLSLSNGAELQTLVRSPSNGTPGGQGNAGIVIVKANGDVSLTGNNADPNQPLTGIFSTIQEGSSGQGGDIGIIANRLFIKNGAQIAVDNEGSGQAGVIVVQARRVILDQQGLLTATTRSGNGGDIDLTRVREYVVLSRNSDIFTTGGIGTGIGDGGNIKINTLFVVATPRENSDIFAGTFGENGGIIQVRATRLFDIARRPLNPTTNDINASALSKSGVDGTVDINTLDIDPSRALANLPSQQLPQLLAEGCRPNGKPVPKDKFYITGRGGLPPNPSERLSTGRLAEDVGGDRNKPAATGVTPGVSEEQRVVSAESNPSVSNQGRYESTAPRELGTEIVEAQGWVRDRNGDVYLTAKASTVTPHSPWLKLPTCHGS